MKRVICYSGGHSSALVAIEVSRKFKNRNLVLLNHDIIGRSESQDIKRFKQEVADYLGLPITFCNMPEWDKKDQFDVVIEAGAFKGQNGVVLCTNRMKTRPFELWLGENIKPGDGSVIYYGFDRNEKGRIQRRSSHLAQLGHKTDYPLALWTKRTIQNTKELGIEPPTQYSQFKHANCTGCLKAGKQHWYVVYVTRPDIWAKALHAEDEIGYSIINGTSLSDLEPLFEEMKARGVPASEHIPSSTFWEMAKSASAGQCGLFPSSELPCECVF